MGIEYAAVPQSERAVGSIAMDSTDEGTGHHRAGGRISWYEYAKRALVLVSLVMFGLVLGFCVGRKHPRMGGDGRLENGNASDGKDELLPSSAFVPEMPMKEVMFDFPTPYEDTSVKGDLLWNALMPLGSGFVRVPHPRQYDMPASKAIEDDPEGAEIYSLSVLHQLHCLGVIRDVVKKYEKHDKSRFAGAGHEYHCIDYLRQSIMCSGDMTLDFAEVHEDGTRRGFSGANSTHQCRDWDSIVSWAVENREGDKKGIA